MHSQELLEKVAKNWDIDIKQIRKDISIAGSPERVDYREVIQDSNDKHFIIEQIINNTVDHKQKIAKAIDYLYSKKLIYLRPYLKTNKDNFLLEHDNAYWQMVDFVEGQDLDRPNYINDAWRGKLLARFLIDLRSKSKDVSGFDPNEVFSIKDYIKDMLCSLASKPDLIKRLTPVLDYLEEDFFKVHDNLRSCFCHGDYHPVNVIWAKDDISSIIDWEFLGYKPEIYDVACMISCVGIEGPRAFTSALVKEFITCLKQANIIEPKSWDYLVEYMIALRFGWISEWLRKDNQEMLEFDIGYTNAMVENAKVIKNILR
jgi:homoserine kinase type II